MSFQDDGLRFECRRCGRCCRGPQPGYVWVSSAEIDRLAARLGLDRDAFGRRFLRQVGERTSLIERQNGDCIFYQEGTGCTVYEDRPDQCRTFPFWPELVESAEAWQRASFCLGIGQGKLYRAEEISAIARGERST